MPPRTAVGQAATGRSTIGREQAWDRIASAPMAAGKVIAVGNLKGGTGKSTLAVNLAGALAAEGQRVCLVDCDPQGTSTSWLAKGHVRVVAETLPVNQVGEVVGWLEHITALVGRFDIVVIDLPSVLTPAMASAFLVAHVILIPVSPSSIDLHATRRMLRHVRMVREERPNARPKVMLVPTRVPEDQLASHTLEQVFADYPERVGPPLRERRDFHEAFAARRWVGQLAPQGAAHADILVLCAAVSDSLSQAASPPLLATAGGAARRSVAGLVPANDHGQAMAIPPPARKSWFGRILSLLT